MHNVGELQTHLEDALNIKEDGDNFVDASYGEDTDSKLLDFVEADVSLGDLENADKPGELTELELPEIPKKDEVDETKDTDTKETDEKQK